MHGLLAAGGLVIALAGSMQLKSPDFPSGTAIPNALVAVECGGDNHTPRLTWSGVPAGVKSFAIVLHDPDAPVPGGFYHWVVYNLPAAARSLKSNPGLPTSELGETSVGKQGYFGPCPPPNSTHHYVFTLYALDIAHVPASPPLTAAQLEHRIAGHIIASAVLRGTASSVEAIP
jgi:Raf kinase inhibitor-like YbhB/YbcL family protein